MITMQRSLSLPGPAHTSPPASPTITHLSSQDPTPENSVVPPRLHRYQSRSPQRPPRSYREPADQDRKTSTSKRTSPSPASRSRETTTLVLDLNGPSSEPTTPAKPPILPLLQDVSQYTNSQFTTTTNSTATTTLEELAHLVRLSTYQERKRAQSRVRLQRSVISTALSARLARCGELAHRTLVDNFRADEKKHFASLYNAIHNVRNSCDATRRFALLEPDLDGGRQSFLGEESSTSVSNFMHEIPLRSRKTFLNFLTQIRTNPDYLASRICSLSTAERTALTDSHRGQEAVSSVLPFHTMAKGHPSNVHRNSANIPTAVERLLSFQRHDPLSALIHTCFANSAGPDSVEDLRRTDVWATTCARMINENKTVTESFICSVLNVWTAMRDWSGRSNMEWYLMKILEDGAFLLETAEDEAGTRIHVEPRNAKDSIAAEEFYTAAVEGLFEIVDDPGAGGIPEGLIELGNAILRKLDDPKKHAGTKRFLVSKWLFTVFLSNVLIHPEYYGMMAQYHITEYGRQKILKEVVMRAQKLVVDMTWDQTSSTPLTIKSHIENILARFHSKRPSRSKAKLLPARSITSLRQTSEVHPYLVLGPADIVTLVNALFPERHSSSVSGRENSLHGLRSSASSISGFSSTTGPVSINARNAFDNVSIVSGSGSSVVSDITTSQQPLLDESQGALKFPTSSISSSNPSSKENQRSSFYEDDGYELRLAITEMAQALGTDGISGSCHPCAERWTVLFVSPDGHNLSTQMLHDPEDDQEEEDFTTSSDEEDNVPSSRSDLGKDYHQLRDSILKLVEDYEIPQTLESKEESMTFSNRTSTLESPRRKKIRSRPTSSAQQQSKNPYRIQTVSSTTDKTFKSHGMKSTQQRRDSSTRREEEPTPILISMLEAAEAQCQAQSDFVSAHLYWKTLNQLHQLSSASLKKDGFASLLSIFSRGPRDSIRRSASAVEEYEAWLVWLKQSQERHDVTTESLMKRLKALRDKMWYVSDVKNSAAYEGARNVAVALKRMVSPKKTYHIAATGHRSRNMSRTSANNFLVKSEAQLMDMMAAMDGQGGPNKLSDEQSEKTLRWLSQFGIENFCKGEERIHRFCLEIETCINKLVADNLMDGPVLWSSELYHRDKIILDSGRQKGDLFINGLGALSISGDDANESDSGRRTLRSTDFSRNAGTGSLRAMSTRNTSQQSFDSGRYSISRMSNAGDIMDAQDYFGMASPVLTIDSTTTFWSPFQTRAQSPTTSISSRRPGTASSTNETVMLREERSNQAKHRFLGELKQTLTSLLVSDLGTLVFAKGSETDSWFSGDLGQDCIERKELAERKLRRKLKRRTLEKKKSFRDLRGAQKPELATPDRLESFSERMERVSSNSTRSTERAAQEQPSNNESSSANDKKLTSTRKPLPRDAESVDFPYRKAFQRLLRMFSVHPNPYAKLNALFELEQLIIAFLTPSGPRRPPRVRPDAMITTLPSPEVQHINAFGHSDNTAMTPRAKTLEEAIDNCRERRSHTLGQPELTSPVHRITDRPTGVPNPASTDMIVEVLQDLFRDADIRPKTLFRDLQFIASFVPASTLDKTERGKAFWDAGLAALGLKQDVCRTLIEIADEVVVHYTQTRKTTSINTQPDSPPTTIDINTKHLSSGANPPSAGEYMKYSMQDAGKMWVITAREGDPVAERELATFYLTHPELVERVTAPLSKPRETFKAKVMEMHGGGGAGVGKEREGDRERSDPATMCVAYHWMGLSAQGGDELAKKYLRQREELNALP